MEVIRLVRSADPGAESSCVVCDAGLDAGSRCEHCGAASAAGGFRVVRLLAQRPHSRVYVAERDGAPVALKELSFSLVPAAADIDAFHREAQLLRTLDHPAIPRLLESFVQGTGVHTRLYLARELVAGRSLLEKLAAHRFSEVEVLEVGRQLLGILTYLHGLSPCVIHRDIKPANVIEREDGRLALVDFGTAREIGLGGTLGSTLVGTFGYMPPEQLGGTVDATADLYSVGATLLHLLTRREPSDFLQPGMRLDFEADLNATPRTKRLLARLMSRSPSGRYVSAAGALTALDAPLEASSAAINPAAYRELHRQVHVPPSSTGLLRRVPPVAIAGAAVLAAVVAGSAAFNAGRRAIERVGLDPPATALDLPPLLGVVGKALEAFHQQRYADAIARADQVIGMDPDSPEASQAVLIKAHALLRLSRTEEARKLLTRFLDEPLSHHRDAAVELLGQLDRLQPR